MSRLHLPTLTEAQQAAADLNEDLAKRVVAAPDGTCPVDMTLAFIQMAHAQSCGKCVPCRIGLKQLANLMTSVLDKTALPETLDDIQSLAQTILDSADCAIGFQAAATTLRVLDRFRDDFVSHIEKGRCDATFNRPVPCVTMCPANVDIPGYIALVGAGRYADAVRLIRKDNPFPTTCGYICEHPCETKCRRNYLESPVNIRGLKKYAVDHCGTVPAPECAPSTGKTVAIIGGGPCGLTAAYFLQLMGHQTVVFEKRSQLGGMLRYGIPSYRLPREKLDDDINAILSTGVQVRYGDKIGETVTMEDLKNQYDALYISIGAHTDKKLGVIGEDANGVMSAVQMLGNIGDNEMPDFKGKNIVVVGGGNVAMDCARSAIRLGAKRTSIVYRRRIKDMTALAEEVEAAQAEGCEVMQLIAPKRIEKDEDGNVKALIGQRQIIGAFRGGRASVSDSSEPELVIPADIIVVAIGQGIETKSFEAAGIPVFRGTFRADSTGLVRSHDGIFAGGDSVTGPATVIRAVAAGKVAASNIDEFLGYHHRISVDVDIPNPPAKMNISCARVNIKEALASDRKENFDPVENNMTEAEMRQEATRCFRCDCHGFGALRGGRETQW